MVKVAKIKLESPDPDGMSDKELDELAQQIPLLKSWLAAVEKRLMEQLEAGVSYSNVELGPTQPRRKWTDEEKVLPRLVKMARIDVVAPRCLISPAEAEKLLGSSKYRTLIDYVKKESGGVTLKYKSADD